MKIKYRLVIEVEGDPEREATPDRWDMDALMGSPAELISYEVVDDPSVKKS